MLAFIFSGLLLFKTNNFLMRLKKTWAIQNYMKNEKGQSLSEKGTFQRSNGHLGVSHELP